MANPALLLYAAGSLARMFALRESGRMARIQGETIRAAAEFNARQADREAGTAIAISQRQAAEERRQANLVASRALAVAAASGGGVSDPTVVRLIANQRGEGAYRASVRLYEGEAKARQLRVEAIAGRISGSQAEAAGASAQLGAAYAQMGEVARTGATLYAKYGMNGPGTTPGASGDAALLDAGTPSFSSVG